MAPYSKPETVLKQAEGLVSVGQTPAALQSLTEMFNSKRFRSTPVASLEPIMIRFIELCVELRKGRTAKEGLMQYKNIIQNTSVQSIETVIHTFIQLANGKVVEAQHKADKAIEVLDVDDLEASESPEDVLLGAVSGDQNKDRTDRALVTPWLKFLWESYRSALETLKNNARLEMIYQSIALEAFKFCLSHRRKVEFRRLCETLRLHLSTVAKYSHQAHSVNLSDPDTLQRFLDTRFAQLNTSVELELWQEAFRSIEDIHNLLTMSKKTPKPSMMINYYEKLYKIFMTSGSILYHAAAWSKYYAILRSSGRSDEELATSAGFVLISALAVPTSAEPMEDGDDTKGKHARLTTLLGLSKIPTRSSLLNDAFARNVLKISPKPLLELYELLEVQFDPLGLAQNASATLQQLSKTEEYVPYLPHLRRVVLSRLLSQLSQVYSSLSISYLLELIAPLNQHLPEDSPHRFDQENIEAFIMGTAKRGELLVRINHASGTIAFVDDSFTSPVPGTSTASLQPSPGKLVRSRLSQLAESLYTVVKQLDQAEDIETTLAPIKAALHAERQALQARRSIVARRRELAAELQQRKQNEEKSLQAEMQLKAQEEAQRRKKADALKEAQERARAEMDRKRKEENVKIVSSLLDRGVAIDADITELDTDKLVQLQVEQMDKERRELNERMRIIAKRMDHIERAFRKEEVALLADDYERQQAEDKAAFESNRQGTIDAAKQAHQEKLDAKRRLARVMPDYQSYVKKLGDARGQDYSHRRAKAEEKILEEKQKRRTTVLAEREREAKEKAERERIQREEQEREEREEQERLAEEKKQQEEAEAARWQEEEKKRADEERLAAARKKREEEKAADMERIRKQREREEEAEQRRRAQRSTAAPVPAAASSGGAWRARTVQAESTPPTPSRPSPQAQPPSRYVPPSQRTADTGPSSASRATGGGGGGGGGWRERERLKETSNSRPGTPGRSSPALPDEDGFQPVRPRPAAAGGAYRPPAARNR